MSDDMTALRDQFDKARTHLRSALGNSFVEVGEALLEMQAVCKGFDKTAEGRAEWEALTGCQTFEEYIRLEHQMAKSNAYRLMDAAKVFRRLEQSPPGGTLPVGEKQCRWLAKVPVKRLPTVWSQVLKRYEEYRTEKASDGKKVSPHPPATFICKHLAKAGFLGGDKEVEFVVADRDGRLVAKATRKLSGVMAVLEKFDLEQEDKFDEIVRKEKWTRDDRDQFIEQLDEIRRWAERCIERARSVGV